MQAIAVLALPLALWLDRVAGEPPARLHPVVAMGRWLALAGPRVAPPAGQGAGGRWRIAAGGLAWGAGALAFGLAAWGAQRWLATLPVWLALPLLVLLLKPMFAWRMLADEVRAVENALAQSLDAGRARLAWLVSRDVAALDAAGVRESAIETLAENLNDSVVAPLFWFAVAGLPGAVVYRYANTADAMWGYRGERGGRDWTRAGRVAARVDDALSWLPARLTALLLWLAAGAPRSAGAPAEAGGQAGSLPQGGAADAPAAARGFGVALAAEAARTPSPNGGWPMGAMALLLGLRLRKPGGYTLNAAGRAPLGADTLRALLLAGRARRLLAWWLPALTALATLAGGGVP